MNKNLFNKELADIIEVTYAYADLWDGKFINKTLLWTFLGKEYSWKDKEEEKAFWQNVWENIENLYRKALVKLNFKKQQVEGYKQQLLYLQQDKNPKLQILLWTLDYLDKILDLTLTWLPFEAEKAWLKHNLNQKEIESRVKRLEEIERELFGGNVRKKKNEVKWSYTELKALSEKGKTKLTSEEQMRFSSYIWILEERFPYIKEEENKKPKKDLETPDVLNSEISRENYIKIFKIVFGIYGIDKEIKIEERSSIYDWEDYLGIPDSDWYKTLKLQRVLQLIQHEIETHYIIEKNNSQTLWKFRWAWNLEREEWLAMRAEWILNGKDILDIQVSWAIPDLLMWEILSGKDFRDFMVLLSKIKDTKNASWMFLRRKRNYPLNYSWVQHKDTSYNRWEHKVVSFLQNGWNVKDLYVWKVSFDDIKWVKQITKAENIKLVFPLLLWELLQYVITWNKLVENEFWDYIEQKYPFLNVRNEIANWSIERLNFASKRKVVQILSLLKS